MATYKNYLKRADGTGILGAQACLYNTDGQRLDVDITEEDGLYYFLGVATGHYQVRFFGRNLTEDDWLEIDVVDEFPDPTISGLVTYDPIIFATTPYLGVVEKDSKFMKQGELVTAEYTITDIETTQGRVAATSIFFRADADNEWQLLDNLNLDVGAVNIDEDLTTITGIAELELPEKPTLFHFKAQFFNPVNEIAEIAGVPVEPFSQVLFYGITDLDEYVGVTNLVTSNTVSAIDANYLTIPTDELVCAWDDMKSVSADTQFYNALGQPVSLTEKQLKNISGYTIFLYISDEGKPSEYPWPYPTTDAYGTWYFNNTVPTNRAIVRIPINTYVKVWVGFKTETTVATTTLTTNETRY